MCGPGVLHGVLGTWSVSARTLPRVIPSLNFGSRGVIVPGWCLPLSPPPPLTLLPGLLRLYPARWRARAAASVAARERKERHRIASEAALSQRSARQIPGPVTREAEAERGQRDSRRDAGRMARYQGRGTERVVRDRARAEGRRHLDDREGGTTSRLRDSKESRAHRQAAACGARNGTGAAMPRPGYAKSVSSESAADREPRVRPRTPEDRLVPFASAGRFRERWVDDSEASMSGAEG